MANLLKSLLCNAASIGRHAGRQPLGANRIVRQ